MNFAARAGHESLSAAAAARRDGPAGRFPRAGAALVLLLAAAVMSAAALLRGTEYDENYSVFVTGGIARPAWPATPFTYDQVREPFEALTTPAATARLLRQTDVHPPLYFWALGGWRRLVGGEAGVAALRSFSVLLALGALAAWMAAAWRAGAPAVAVGALTALGYGFAYTGHVARGFALAHLLLALAALAAVEARRRRGPGGGLLPASAAGLAVGLASFSNYLAIFPGAAILAWLVLWAEAPGGGGLRARIPPALAAGLPLAALLAADMTFFLAQRGSRPDQFEAFALLPALARLAQMNAASLLGGLPLYVPGGGRRAARGLGRAGAGAGGAGARGAGGMAGHAAPGALAVPARRRGADARAAGAGRGLRQPAGGAALRRLRRALRRGARRLRLGRLARPRAARGAPRARGAARRAGGRASRGWRCTRPRSSPSARPSPPPRRCSAPPDALLLVPFGNDGVGVTGSLLREAPAGQRLLVLREADAAQAPSRAEAAGARRLVLVGMGDRGAMAQAEAALAALRADPAAWRPVGRLLQDHRGRFVEAFEAVTPPPRG
jgi:peptidoglycan/LPS O-acetylase OafA/YrhL